MIRKFDFAARFDEPAPHRDAPPPPKYGEAELAAVREAGRLEGIDQGRAEAAASLTAKIESTLKAIGAKLTQLLADREQSHEELAARTVRTVMAVVNRALPELARRHSQIEIDGLIHTCLSELYDEPRVVIRAADPVIETLQGKIDALAAACGFTGKVALFGDPEMASDDCRVEWADGGAERSFETTWRAIATAIERSLVTQPSPKT
jgi:flagellar assembly protein FliH